MSRLAQLVLLVGSAAVMLAAADYNVTLYEKSTLAGTELKPGDYKVEVNGDRARVYNRKQSVEAKVKMESGGDKYASTSVRYNGPRGDFKLVEIRLGGTNTRITFDN